MSLIRIFLLVVNLRKEISFCDYSEFSFNQNINFIEEKNKFISFVKNKLFQNFENSNFFSILRQSVFLDGVFQFSHQILILYPTLQNRFHGLWSSQRPTASVVVKKIPTRSNLREKEPIRALNRDLSKIIMIIIIPGNRSERLALL